MQKKWHSICFLFFLLCIQSNPLQAAPANQHLNADYVVVGVGTAGAVVAKKLSDDKKTSVIALCIGENLTHSRAIKFSKNAPITAATALIGPPFFENGNSTPQPNADLRKILWAIALPEGGASSVNVGAYVRGTNEVYTHWETIAGPKWSVARILEIFKELETYQGETPNPEFRGEHGPIHVRQVPHPSKVSETFTQAINKVNPDLIPLVLDYNDPFTPIGASSKFQFTQSGPNGRFRVSSVNAFLNQDVVTQDGHGVNGRKLEILFNSTGLRTIWEGKKAVGVEYLQDGEVKKVYANKGVIVSAGLFSSAFLMHSGVGPKAVLEPLKIPIVFDNPNVGEHFVDHPFVNVLFTSNPADFSKVNLNSPFAQIAFLPEPDGDPNVRKFRFAAIDQVPGVSLVFFDLLQPKSRGRIAIKSPNPLVPPAIDFGFLSNPNDLALYVSGFQNYIKEINAQLQSIDPLYELLFPDLSIINDTPRLESFIRENIGSNQSGQSHCLMAPLDQGGVVGSDGAVHGVKHLYVADDSIVPFCMDGAPMASAYLIGANIARILIEEK